MRNIALAFLLAPSLLWAQERGGEFELVERRAYGALDDDGEDAGAVLSVPVGLAVVESMIYILDQQWPKLVAFREDGEVSRVLREGRGEGPGEFRQPSNLELTEGRRLSVHDPSAARITEFGLDGEVLETIPMRWGGFDRHVVLRDTILVTQVKRPGTAAPLVWYLSRQGDSLGVAPPLEVEDRPFGPVTLLTRSPSGEVLASFARPGVWYRFKEGEWSRRGTPIYPDQKPPVVEPRDGYLRITPSRSSVAGIAALRSGLVLQHFWSYDRAFDWEDPPKEKTHHLAVFREDGTLIQILDLPSDRVPTTKRLFVHPERDVVYLPVAEPFPQVLELELRRRSDQREAA